MNRRVAAAWVLVSLLCMAATARADHEITFQVLAPTLGENDSLYITGNHPSIGGWNPAGRKLTRKGDTFTTTVSLPEGFSLEYKFTLGSWEREALNADGSVPPNHTLTVTGPRTIETAIGKFKDGAARPAGPPTAEGSGVLGTLVYHHDVESKHLNFKRHVAVWLPPGYDKNADARYPVLYMHDGQNLFDPRIANTGVDWGVDEAAVKLIDAGAIPPIIIVGVFNSPARSIEYNPLRDGEKYAKFLIEELKPFIDKTYRTRPEAKYTAVSGSSAGGLISIHLGVEHSDVFTRIGALSAHVLPIPTSFGGTGESYIDHVRSHGPPNAAVRFYIDASSDGLDATYGPAHAELKQVLTGWGWKEGENLLVRQFENTRHTEADWRKRFEIPLRFMFEDLARE